MDYNNDVQGKRITFFKRIKIARLLHIKRPSGEFIPEN